MLIKSAFIQLLLFYSLAACTQDANAYRKAIYDAETALITENYKAAVQQYKTAFRLEKDPFPSDIIIAFQTALLTGSRRDIKSLWKIVRHHGYFVTHAKKDKLLLSYIYPSLRKKIKKYVTPDIPKTRLEQLADSILNEDQALRHRCPNNLKKECIELFRERDSTHIYFLRNLLLTNAYTRKDFSSDVCRTLYVVALHARRFGHTTLDSLLIAYTRERFIKPDLYAQLNTYQTDLSEKVKKKLDALPRLGFGQSYMLINDTTLLLQLPDSITAIYDKNRKEIFMDNVQREMDKLRFVLKQPLFKESMASLGLAVQIFRMSRQEEKELIERFKPFLIQ